MLIKNKTTRCCEWNYYSFNSCEHRRLFGFLQLGDVTTPEQVFNGNLGNDDVYETSENITEADIVVNEDGFELMTTEVLEDVGIIDSDDEFSFNEKM